VQQHTTPIKLSSPRVPPGQHLWKHRHRIFDPLKRWTVIVALIVILVLLFATGLICVAIPLALLCGMLLATLHLSYEIRFTSPVSDVWDAGDALIVERYGVQHSIPLAAIRNLDFKTRHNPPSSRIEIDGPFPWGPVVTWFPQINPTRDATRIQINQLRNRIEIARHAATGDEANCESV
jgi:hypothetical protein